MTTAPPGKYIWDAWRAAERVFRFTAGENFEAHRTDEVLRSTVERQSGIVGEALAAPRRTDPTPAASIPELPRVVAFRNILVHGYATVDDRLVWGVVERDLAKLRNTLARSLPPE